MGEIYGGFYAALNHATWFCSDMIKRKSLLLIGKDGNATSPRVTSNPLEVVGVGYGRTGTYSLGLALNDLGYPTLHTQHMYENPAILDMWSNEVFLPAIQEKGLYMGSPDFDLISSHGFTGAVDFPIALYFEQINKLYPNCKFILTTRENSDIWFKSWSNLQTSLAEVTNFSCPFGEITIFQHVVQISRYVRWLFSLVNKDQSILEIPLGAKIPPSNKENAIASYEEHNRRVRESIPPERLLEYNVKEGWEPLCKFLDVPETDCPQIPFPKTNSALSLKVQAYASIFAGATITTFLILIPIYFFMMKRRMNCRGNKRRASWTERIRLQLHTNFQVYFPGKKKIT